MEVAVSAIGTTDWAVRRASDSCVARRGPHARGSLGQIDVRTTRNGMTFGRLAICALSPHERRLSFSALVRPWTRSCLPWASRRWDFRPTKERANSIDLAKTAIAASRDAGVVWFAICVNKNNSSPSRLRTSHLSGSVRVRPVAFAGLAAVVVRGFKVPHDHDRREDWGRRRRRCAVNPRRTAALPLAAGVVAR
jgi:hypothetical protein